MGKTKTKTKTKTKILDEKWFKRLCDVGDLVEETEWFQGHVQVTDEEKELFLNNETENPQFINTKDPVANGLNQAIESLVNDLHEQEKDVIVLDLYKRKIVNQKIRSQLISHALSGNDAEFYANSVELYGKPHKKYFAYVAKRVIELADSRSKQFSSESKRLKRVMAKIDCTGVDISADILPPIVKDAKALTSANQAAAIFNDTLTRLNITGWKVVVDQTDKRARFSVNPYQKIVHIPGEKQLFARPEKITDIKLKALAEHEVGVHARRAYEGSRSGLLLLQIGLDSYLSGEEGLAGYSQQQIEGAQEFYGFDRYLAASLAVGMDGLPRDFRAVFSLMTDFYTLQNNKPNESNAAAITAAWNVCMRIFRGTTGQTAGMIYTKDIAYMEGNIDIWHLMSDKPDCFESLFLGKFNPLLDRHIRSLQTLEILKEW